MIYRGYDITNNRGAWEWTDEEGRIHNGLVNGVPTFKTEEDVMNDIDAYRKAKRAS